MAQVLEVEQVVKSFRAGFFQRKEILHRVSFEVGEQEIVGFIGPNGAGKSTLLKCISGLYFPNEGRITVGGCDVARERARALEQMGVSIEYPALYPELTGAEHFRMVAGWRGAGRSRVREMEEFSGLERHLKEKAGRYSMGMKQRLILALSLLHHPKLLLLDEPTNGLDPEAIFQLRQQLEQIRREGTSVLFSSHQLDEVERVSDRIVFIREGSIIYNGKLPGLSGAQSYLFRVSDAELAVSACGKLPGVKASTGQGSSILLEAETEQAFAESLSVLTAAGLSIYSIQRERMELEVLYKDLYHRGEKIEKSR